jgi:hypothetical protein
VKRSEKLSEFLNFICQVKPEYDYYLDVQADAEAKILDLLHEIELVPHNAFDMVKIYKQLRESRKQRRLAKDSIRELTPLVTWAEDNKKEIEALKRTLGDVRKVEKMEDGRIYLYRTEIVAETLKKNDRA